MRLIKWINSVKNIGVKDKYAPWEIYLTRKLNFMALFGSFNIAFAILFFYYFNYKVFIPECVMTLILAPFVILLNYKKNYIWATYLFYFIGIVLYYLMTIKMGVDTYVILYYFPVIISLVQVLGRKETLVHLLVLLSLFFISIILLMYTYQNSSLRLSFTPDVVSILRDFNIVASFFITIVLISALTIESIKQESIIKNVLHEKEVLLAEVFHRVKNNMNIVTSLLNLKKHASDSQEVKDAIEECRERVYSMALVHQKIYNNKTINSLDFKEYVNDLVQEAVNSIGGSDSIDVVFTMEQVNLPINYAIPCGLIVNEVITNSFKYGHKKEQRLKLEIGLLNSSGNIVMTIKDNGPGFDFNKVNKENSLGMELIKSLSEQIDAQVSITNDNGALFKMEFRSK